MKASELVAYLQTVIDKHGDLDIYVYDRSDYEFYPVDDGSITKEEVKSHPVEGYEYIKCRPDAKWLGRTQTKFAKQPSTHILSINGRRY